MQMKYIISILIIMIFRPQMMLWGQVYDPAQAGRIVVADENGQALIGAHVAVVCGADTVRGITTKRIIANRVQAEYKCDRYFKDSVSVQISYVGYKAYRNQFSVDDFNRGIYVNMKEDEQAIGQIVVLGNSVAMVIKGDTTIYNASAFKTMDGDRFTELIKQLPGVEIRNNKIYAEGQEIKRVYVDGRNMFGINAGYALSDLEASDVKNVKVYDEENALAKRVGDDNAPKDKVMDVVTHNKRTVLKGGTIEALGGASFEQDYSGRHEIRHREVGAVYRNTEAGNVRLEISNSKDDGNNDQIASGSKTAPLKQFKSYLLHEYRRGDSTTVMTYANFNRDKSQKMDEISTDYFSTPEYAYRFVRSRRDDENKAYAVSVGNQLILLRKASSISTNFNFQYDGLDALSLAGTDQNIDDNTTWTHTWNSNKNRKYELDAIINYRRYFSPQTSLFANMAVSYDHSAGSGWNVDTLASDPGLRVRLNNRLRSNIFSCSAVCEVDRRISEHSNLVVAYTIRYQHQNSEYVATDYLDTAKGKLDSINTYDYTVNSLWNALSGQWVYTKNDTRLEVVLQGILYNVNRDDRFPMDDYTPHHFILFNPAIRFSTGKPQGRFCSRFELYSSDISTEMLRNSLNATNPQFLQAGNPDLKPTTTALVNLQYSLMNDKSARYVSFGLSAEYGYNYIASKQIIFKENTYLPQYNYTAQPWSQLSTYANVDGNYRLSANIDYSQRMASLKSSFRMGLEYGFGNVPYFLGGERYDSQKHNMLVKIGFISGFSSKIKLSVNNTTDMGIYSTQEGKSRYIRELLVANLELLVATRYFAKVSCVYDMYRNDTSSLLAQDDVVANAEIGCKLGKKKRFHTSFGIANIFNKINYLRSIYEADYIRTSGTSYLGRYGYIRFRLEF